MNNKTLLAVIGLCLAGMCLLTGKPAPALDENGKDRKEQAVVERQMKDILRQEDRIARLASQLQSEHEKLNKMRTKLHLLPAPLPLRSGRRGATVLNTNGETQIINAGKKDGLRPYDRLIALQYETDAKITVKGLIRLERVYDTDSEAVAVVNFGISPENRVYIINRDDSSLSLANGYF
jgi:hypothetical protein